MLESVGVRQSHRVALVDRVLLAAARLPSLLLLYLQVTAQVVLTSGRLPSVSATTRHIRRTVHRLLVLLIIVCASHLQIIIGLTIDSINKEKIRPKDVTKSLI